MATEALAFTAVFDRCYSPVAAYALRRSASAADAEDVVSEVFTTAWRRWPELSQIDNPLPWLYGVAGNVVRSRGRSAARHLKLVEKVARQPELTDPGPEGLLGSDLLSALDQLSFDDREVLRLIAWEGLSHAEAAETLQCSVNAVGLRISRARQRLAQYLEMNNVSDTQNTKGSTRS